MMWVLMCFIAVAIGFIMYSSIEEKMPEPLRLPKGSSKVGAAAGAAGQGGGSFGPVASSSRMWQVRGDGQNVELVRDFRALIEHQGQQYDAPTLLLTCYGGELFVGVDLHMAPAMKGERAQVKVNTATQSWTAGEGHRLYSPAPKSVLAAVRAEKPFDLVLPYAELGAQRVTFEPVDGAKALAYFPASCR